MRFFNRGLFALILTIFFHNTVYAQYLYKDEVLFNNEFKKEINTLGNELYEKTGIALRVVMLKKLPKNITIVEYEKELIKDFNSSTILLTFAEDDKQVDIYASDASLYKYFDKRQVLSPVSSLVQAFAISVINFRNFDGFMEGISNYGGTILPIISLKNMDGEVLGKYSAGVYNGYCDIAEQIAEIKEVELMHSSGNTNKDTILVVKIVFYGFVLYAIIMFVRRKYYTKAR